MAKGTRPIVRELEPEPMNGTDAALWDIERDPALRTTVVSVLELDRAVQPKRLLRSIDESSRLMPRMRQRVVEAPLGIGPPSWKLSGRMRYCSPGRSPISGGSEPQSPLFSRKIWMTVVPDGSQRMPSHVHSVPAGPSQPYE